MMKGKISGGDAVWRNAIAAAATFPEAVLLANLDTAETIIDQARRTLLSIDAHDTGELYDSGFAEPAGGTSVVAGFSAKHAPYIEFGTRPHFPPVAPIMAWCQRKGLPVSAAYGIVRKIGKFGTPERPYFLPAIRVVAPQHIKNVRAAVTAGLKRVLKSA